jgi:hypothetical protein
MTDMGRIAGDLNTLADGLDHGGNPLRAVRAAQKVIGRDVRVALVDPPANLGNCNQGSRLLAGMSKAFGKIEGGNTSRIAVAACASVMRDIAKECAKW